MFPLVVLLVLLTAGQPGAEGSSPVCDLTVVIRGLDSDRGEVKIALSDSEIDYKGSPGEPPFRGASVAIHGNRSVHTFPWIPFGVYAIKAFHDENDNDRLDTNFLRIPKEPYGFSNDVRGSLGPPSFDRASFQVDVAVDTVWIHFP